MKPYKEGSRHGDIDNAYDACSTCYHVKDRTGTYTCANPKMKDTTEIHSLANNGAGEHVRPMGDSTDCRVQANEWCSMYKAADSKEPMEYGSTYEAMESAYEQHSPTPHAEYGTGGVAGGGAGAGGGS